MWNPPYDEDSGYARFIQGNDQQDDEFLRSLYEKENYWIGSWMPYRNWQGFKVKRNGCVICYTDGACPSNGRQGATAGIGVWFGRDHHLNVSEPLDYEDKPTNQVAEIKAAIKAIEVAKDNGVGRLIIYSDSSYLVNSMNEYIFKWLSNGWKNSKGQILGHRPLFRELLFAMEDMNVDWYHVRGHGQDPDPRHHEGNDMADYLAHEGAKCY